MVSRNKILLSILLCMLTLSAVAGESVHPKILIATTGYGVETESGTLIFQDGKVTRRFKARGSCQDAWMLENGDVLVTETVGITKYDKIGKVLMRYTAKDKKNEVHSCQPLPNGRTLIAESGPARLLELDAKGKIVKTIPLKDVKFNNPHLHMRGARKNKKGEYGIIASGQMQVIILNADGTTKKIIDMQKLLEKIKHRCTHGLAMLDDGNILVSTSYGSCFVELDPKGKVVWSLTPQDVPKLELKYASGMQRLANGNTICTAYGGKYPIFEVTPDNKIVWKIAANKEIGQPLHVQVIKENDKPSTFKLYK